MARYKGPACRLCRRYGTKLLLKGERCFTPRCAVERRKNPPGEQRVQSRRRRLSEHGEQLREKQKAREVYGVLERQFQSYVARASHMEGVTGDRLLQILERRLDNVAFRLGFADSRQQARQRVSHGHLRVNGKRADIPSLLVKPGDEITWREQSSGRDFLKAVTASLGKRPVPGWLSLDESAAKGTVVALPGPGEIDSDIDTRMIVEFYSKR
ncbi:MAG: 30S ribosomal protein S4 [Gemmatimonadetes bacterium]|nr:30S ribosomal protein S4 [Gemmatimonadota bacterium]